MVPELGTEPRRSGERRAPRRKMPKATETCPPARGALSTERRRQEDAKAPWKRATHQTPREALQKFFFSPPLYPSLFVPGHLVALRASND